MTMTAPRTEQHTTCPQPHKQLLVGWVVGGTTMGRGDETTDQHCHITAPPCSWGGPTTRRSDDGDDDSA